MNKIVYLFFFFTFPLFDDEESFASQSSCPGIFCQRLEVKRNFPVIKHHLCHLLNPTCWEDAGAQDGVMVQEYRFWRPPAYIPSPLSPLVSLVTLGKLVISLSLRLFI